MAAMEPLKAMCETCWGHGARRRARARVSATNVIFEGAAVETCEVCRGQGSFPMPGRLIVGSLRGLLDGPEPGLA